MLTLWLALAGKLDLFAQFWTALVSGADTMNGGASGGGIDVVGGEVISDQTLNDYLKTLPNPPKIPPGAEWIFK